MEENKIAPGDSKFFADKSEQLSYQSIKIDWYRLFIMVITRRPEVDSQRVKTGPNQGIVLRYVDRFG